MTSAELLAPVNRWTPSRKRALVQGIKYGTISIGDAMKAHALSADEIVNWARGRVRASSTKSFKRVA